MTMKTQIILFAWLCSGLNLLAQPAQLTREAYRDRVENYSQVLKQQKLKSMASTEGRKIAFTGFLPQIDITGEGTLNLKEMDAWNALPDNIVTIPIRGRLLWLSLSIPVVPCKPGTR